MKSVTDISDELLLHFIHVLYDYRKGVDITDPEFSAWLDGMMNENLSMDIRHAEMLLSAEAAERFGYMVKYLLYKRPEEFLKL